MAIAFPNREEFAALWSDADVSVADISRRYCVTQNLVRRWAERFRLSRRADTRNRIDRSRDGEFRRDWNSGVPVSSLVAKYGVQRKAIEAQVRRLRLRKRKPVAVAKRAPIDIVRFDVEPLPQPGDPTPEEIESRKAEVRATWSSVESCK